MIVTINYIFIPNGDFYCASPSVVPRCDKSSILEYRIMQGDQGVLDRLNKLLTGELSAADQYLSHARTMEDMGLKALSERISHERVEELEHADKLIRRILFLEGTPDVASRDPIHIGKTVPEMMRNDLTLEYEVVAALKEAIAYC